MDKVLLNSVLIKTSRLSAWLLLPLMIIFFITGYSMIGKYGANAIIGKGVSVQLHASLAIVTLIAFLLHSGIEVYFAVKRWGWIKAKIK